VEIANSLLITLIPRLKRQ